MNQFNLDTASIFVVDTETTGVTKQDQIIQMCLLPLQDNFKDQIELTYLTSYYLPDVPIHPQAAKVHNITRQRLLNKPKANTVNLPSNTQYLIGHNLSFDLRMLVQTNILLADKVQKIKPLCTLSMYKLLYNPEKTDKCDLVSLYQKFYPYTDINLLHQLHHDARADVELTYKLFLAICTDKLSSLATITDVYQHIQKLKSLK